MPSHRVLLSFPTRRSSDLHFPPAIDFRAHGRRIEPADDLVGEVQVPLVTRRHVERRGERFVEHTNRVVPFEPRPQVVEDPPRLDRKSTRLNSSHPSISYAVPPCPPLFPYTTLFRSSLPTGDRLPRARPPYRASR